MRGTPTFLVLAIAAASSFTASMASAAETDARLTGEVDVTFGYSGSYSLSGKVNDVDVLVSLTYRDTRISYDANGEIVGFDNTQGDTRDSETVNAFIKTGYSWDDLSQNNSEKHGLKLTLIKDDIAGARHEVSELQVDDFTTLYSYNRGQFVEGGRPEFSETLSNIGATYAFNDVQRVYANYCEGFSMPDVGRTLRDIKEPNQTVESFLDLQPILTENQEIGLEFSDDRFNTQVAYYTSDSDFGQLLSTRSDGIYSVSRQKTEIDGVELRGQWFATDTDTIEARYVYTRGRSDSDGDGKVDKPGRPQHRSQPFQPELGAQLERQFQHSPAGRLAARPGL